jgi:lysozyme family protein
MISRLLTLERWQKCEIPDSHKGMYETLANRVLSYKQNYYDPVENGTGVPWYLVAGLDMREEDFNHNGYLGNGDPLWKPTTHVPRGRGPFLSWHAGAVDALHHDGMIPSKGEGHHWDIVTVLIAAEKYNGLGPYYRGIPSSYIWSGTNIQVAGKYVADGVWDPHAWDIQPGVAGLLLALKTNHGIDLNEA